jgi:hypothetical protein
VVVAVVVVIRHAVTVVRVVQAVAERVVMAQAAALVELVRQEQPIAAQVVAVVDKD